MGKQLKDNISSRYVEAANALRGKHARRRIIAYVESYDDVYFWRTVLSRFENERRYFEVMLPSKSNLSRGKKSVLMNFVFPEDRKEGQDERLGDEMIACVDADYDYLLQGSTELSRRVIDSPFVFHTYAYAIENFQCYSAALHDICVAVTLNDHRIFDFQEYFRRYSEVLFPLFVWSIMTYRNGKHNKFTITDFNRIADPGGFNYQDPEKSIGNIQRKVGVKIRELQRTYPNAKEQYLKLKDELRRLGVTPQTTYLYIQGHHLFDTVVAPILNKVCNILRIERETEINQSHASSTQKRNELACYGNSQQDIKMMMKKSMGYQQCPLFLRIQDDVARFLASKEQKKNPPAAGPDKD